MTCMRNPPHPGETLREDGGLDPAMAAGPEQGRSSKSTYELRRVRARVLPRGPGEREARPCGTTP